MVPLLFLLLLQAPQVATPPSPADCEALYQYIARTVVAPHDTLALLGPVEQTRTCSFNQAREAYLAQLDFHYLYLDDRYAEVLAFEGTHPFWESLTTDDRRYANVKHLIGNAYTMRGEMVSSLWNYLAAAPWHENGGKLWAAVAKSYSLLYHLRMLTLQVLLVTFLTIYFFRSGGEARGSAFLRLQATQDAELYDAKGRWLSRPSIWLAAALRDRVTARTRSDGTIEGELRYRDEDSVALVVDEGPDEERR